MRKTCKTRAKFQKKLVEDHHLFYVLLNQIIEAQGGNINTKITK